MTTPNQVNAPPPQKLSFGAPPADYIAGLGRGAVGFITRSDIGPSKLGGEAQFFGPKDEDDRADYSDTKYDKWSGYEGSLFAGTTADDEDKEADEMFYRVDTFMDSRRRKRREEIIREEAEKFKKDKPTIKEQFKDAKRALATLSESDWLSIPDAHDYKVKKAKRDKYVPVPDRIIDQARKDAEISTSLNANSGTMSNLNELGEARGTVLNLKMDKVGDSVTGQSNVDPKGYLTAMGNLPMFASGADIGDLKKARLLIKNAIETNPKNAPVWIAAARVEELDGKLQAARNFINQGLIHCQESEDLWLEASRLETPDNARSILGRGVSKLPNSVKLWLAAADKEPENTTKKKILQRGIDHNPKNLRLWRELIELATEEEAREYLHKAVKFIPDRVDLWLALARLEDYENAKIVLNDARMALPTEGSIWVYAAKLEETQGNVNNIDIVLKRGLKILAKNGVTIKREDWFKEAENAEKSGAILTSKAIVKCIADYGIDEDEKEKAWLEEAQTLINSGNIETARAIYYHSISVFPENENLWLTTIEFEKKHGTTEALEALFEKSITECKQSETLWLQYAKHKWNLQQTQESRTILQRGFVVHLNSERLYLAAAKLEREVGRYEEAREIYKTARENCNTPKIWMQSAQLEREINKNKEALELIKEALKKHSTFPKLWMIGGQILELLDEIDAARKFYDDGIAINKNSVQLWICLVHLEIKQKNLAKARSILEKAKIKNPSSSDLWITSFYVERADNNEKGAKYVLNRALQECSKSGELWALSIETEPRHLRTAKSVEAMKHCDNDPFVILGVAKQFWREKKLEKAKKWLDRSIECNKDYGDAWVYYYKFAKSQNDNDLADELLRRSNDADPHHGRLWIKYTKRVENWKLKPAQIILLAVADVENEFDE